MASKLDVYNGALRLLGLRELQSLSESTDPKIALDVVWTSATRSCLEAGLWTRAMRAIEANSDPSVEPTFGFAYAFRVPNDFLRVDGVFRDSFEHDPLPEYRFEQEYFYAAITPIYIRYVSIDPEYGMNLGKWTGAFQLYVEAHIAARLCGRLGGDLDKQAKLFSLERQLKLSAENLNAMDQPARFPPMGGWARSRLASGFRGSRLGGTGRGL